MALDEPMDADNLDLSTILYGLARLAGKQPPQAIAAIMNFGDDGIATWTDEEHPTYEELFATIERTILDELP